ncbi:hypothetical protein MA16_Dca000554 [Dendrobium catenatum]|uniref:Uncharacterized protein n=1 Tax=Dendrobium catenatum TaxID=906689 RepID=A0A2I0WU76_9ASPA|nr:hypothetical protein MA16_Dca000554 [Dendrobium catenatum]
MAKLITRMVTCDFSLSWSVKPPTKGKKIFFNCFLLPINKREYRTERFTV